MIFNKSEENYINAEKMMQEELELKDNEIKILKKELLTQLDLRERELKQYIKLTEKYNNLEKRYNALRESLLGRTTIRYWKLRKKINKIGKRSNKK